MYQSSKKVYIVIIMNKVVILLLFPIFSFGQNNICGEKPIKPIRSTDISKKEWKQSDVYIDYKDSLREWKACMSPLGINERDEARLERKKIEVEKRNKIENTNPCGNKPDKPKRPKGISIDDFRKSAVFIDYKKSLKKWKACMSPTQLTEPVFSRSEEKDKIKNPCGEKPNKPTREDGLNHEEYKQTKEYKKFQGELRDWKDCEELFEKRLKWGDCGDKPNKPTREDGLNHEEYKLTTGYIKYKEELQNWRSCIEMNKSTN